MPELLVKIVLAHLLGDFVFQTNKMVKGINKKGMHLGFLYLHVLIHFILLLVLTGFQVQYILPLFILTLSHLLIDILTKVVLKRKLSELINLIVDQTLHGIAILCLVAYYYDIVPIFQSLLNFNQLLLLTTIVNLTFVSSIVIKKTMESINYKIPNNGIKNAGQYIGFLERLFIFGFIILNFWEGIGFLLAAKSIFRFGDLKEKREVKLTEYILIGTLLSFGMAMGFSLLYLKVKELYCF